MGWNHQLETPLQPLGSEIPMPAVRAPKKLTEIPDDFYRAFGETYRDLAPKDLVTVFPVILVMIYALDLPPTQDFSGKYVFRVITYKKI